MQQHTGRRSRPERNRGARRRATGALAHRRRPASSVTRLAVLDDHVRAASTASRGAVGEQRLRQAPEPCDDPLHSRKRSSAGRSAWHRQRRATHRRAAPGATYNEVVQGLFVCRCRSVLAALPEKGLLMPDLTPGVPSALSPLVRRIVAPNPGPFTGPGTNTYLVGIDEVAVIDPGPDDGSHIDAIVGASMRERVRWVVLTHTHPDHWPGTERLVKATGAEVLALRQAHRQGRDDRSRSCHRRRRHDRGHRVRPRGAAHPGSRTQPPLLPARRGTGPLHGRQCARGHVLGDQHRTRRGYDRLSRTRSGGSRSSRLARFCPGHGDVIEEPRPGSRSTSRTGSIASARCSASSKRAPRGSSTSSHRSTATAIASQAGGSRRLAGARALGEARGRRQGRRHVGEVGLEARLTTSPSRGVAPPAPRRVPCWPPCDEWCQQDGRCPSTPG